MVLLFSLFRQWEISRSPCLKSEFFFFVIFFSFQNTALKLIFHSFLFLLFLNNGMEETRAQELPNKGNETK